MKVLIVDDDRTLADLLAFAMRRAGYEPHLAFDAQGAMRVFDDLPVDIIILDVNLPGTRELKNGFDICREVRKVSDVPIILLTVRDDEEDIVKGLNIGADDYILKPFSPRQLVARVQAVLRRASAEAVPEAAPYNYQDFQFDPARREVSRGDEAPQSLTRLESRLLSYLMLNQGQVLPADNIITEVWELDAANTEMLRQLVHRLRMKIEQDPENPILIKTLPGIGYGFGM
ncbi:MAG TPA: response regulator transcription factor [Brevefilum sp.]